MSESEPAIKPDQIAAAEALLGLEFSAEQREQMRKVLSDRLEHYGVIRAEQAGQRRAALAPVQRERRRSRARARPAQLRPERSGQPVTRPADLEDAAFYTGHATRRAAAHAPGHLARAD